MSDLDTKPTPASGMPAAFAATSVARPSGEEIAAPKGAEASAILAAIERVREEGHERERKSDERFVRIERKLDDVVAKTAQNTKNIGEQAEALTRVASAAAKAADLALEAKQQATRAPDETTKIVESAIRIHSTAIAATVDEAVKRAVAPLAADVDTLKRSDEAKTRTLEAQDAALETLKKSDEAMSTQVGDIDKKVAAIDKKVGTVVTSVGAVATGVASLLDWKRLWWVKALVALATAVGAFYGGYRAAARPEPKAPSAIVAPSPAPPALPASTP